MRIIRQQTLLLISVFVSSSVIAATTPVTWSVKSVAESVVVGTVNTVSVSFVSTAPLANVNVTVVPALRGYLFTSTAFYNSVPQGKVQTLLLFFNMPKGSSGTLFGSIRIVDSVNPLKTYSLPLPIQITAVPPSTSYIPTSFAMPSPDRVVTEPDLENNYFVNDEVDIFVKPGTTQAVVASLASGIGGVFLGSVARLNLYQIEVPQQGFHALSALNDQLSTSSIVKLAVHHLLLDSLVVPLPNDPGTVSSYAPPLIKLPNAWQFSTGSKTLDSNQDVLGMSIIDTVFDNQHPDLQGNILKPATNSAPPLFLSSGFLSTNDHGTRVASIVGGVANNGIGIAGVMWQASMRLYSASYSLLHFISVLEGKLDGVLLAVCLQSALQDGTKVLNFSSAFECKNCSPDELRALDEDDAVFSQFIDASVPDTLWVFGAGNMGVDAAQSSPARLGINRTGAPARSNVLTVSAVDGQRRLASFFGGESSNYGLGTIAAPGVAIASDVPGGSYSTASGTSLATPFVTGVAGLMLSVNSQLTAPEIKNDVMKTADFTGTADPEGNGIQLLNSCRAVRYASGFTTFQLNSSNPANGASTVPINSSILVNFSAPVDAQQISGELQVFSGSGQQVSGTVLVLNQQSVEFVPSQPLQPATAYLVDLRSVSDICSDNLSGSTSVSFVTAAPVLPPPALTATKTASPSTVTSGGTITYTITVQNAAGTADALNLSIADPLQMGLSYVSCTTSLGGGCSAPSGIPTASFPTLAAGASAT